MPDPFYIALERRVVFIGTGQSNGNRSWQAAFQRIAANEGPRLCEVQTCYHGGHGLVQWVSGSPGSFARAADYRNDFYNWDGAPTGLDDGAISAAVAAAAASFAGSDWEIWLMWFQGETDAESPGMYNTYRQRFEAMLGFLRADLAPTRIRWCAALPYRSDGVNAAGLAVVRAQLQAAADADPFGIVVPTDDFPRGDGVHLGEPGDSELMARRMWDALLSTL